MAFDLGAVVAHIKADITDFKTGIDTARREVSNFGESAKSQLEAVNKGALVASAALAGVAFAGFKLAETAGKYESIRDSFQSMTEGMGVNVDEFEKRVAKASAGTLDRLTILQGGTRALSLLGKESFTDFGTDFEKMAELSKKAARATGQDVNFMFDSLILGVSRSSKLILDNLGINVSLEESYEKFAQSVGKASSELTAQEQKAALLQGALAQLESNYGNVAVTAGGFQGAMQKLNTILADAKIEIGTALIPAFNELVRAITPMIVEYLPPLIRFITDAVTWFRSLSPEIQRTVVIFLALIPVVATATGIVLALIPVVAALLSPIGALIAIIITLAAVVAGNFNTIRANILFFADWLVDRFNSLVSFVSGWGGRILSAIVSPFESAWNRIRDLMNKIKDALDFTKRHSPSVVDIVNRGVAAVNTAFEKLDMGVNMTAPQVAASFVPSTAGGMITNVQISLEGAIIADQAGASRMAELIGDNIISKVKSSQRI